VVTAGRFSQTHRRWYLLAYEETGEEPETAEQLEKRLRKEMGLYPGPFEEPEDTSNDVESEEHELRQIMHLPWKKDVRQE